MSENKTQSTAAEATKTGNSVDQMTRMMAMSASPIDILVNMKMMGIDFTGISGIGAMMIMNDVISAVEQQNDSNAVSLFKNAVMMSSFSSKKDSKGSSSSNNGLMGLMMMQQMNGGKMDMQSMLPMMMMQNGGKMDMTTMMMMQQMLQNKDKSKNGNSTGGGLY